MAGKPVGVMFAEIGLDATKLERSLESTYKKLQDGTIKVEDSYKSLGIKSDQVYEQMRRNAVAAVDYIKNKTLSSKEEIIRAEQAAANKIKQINEQQYGVHTSLLDRMKQNWIGLAAAATAAYLVISKVGEVLKDITLVAARYETMGIVMSVVGKNAGYSREEMLNFADSLEKTGISMLSARQSLTMMARAQLDLTKATQLGRIAQDSAVIGNINSSQAFEQMIYGIQTANVRVLRTIGINVQFKESYAQIAKEMGRTVASFSEAEKAAIRMNEVIESGKTIAGTYEAAMSTAGKQLLSFERHWENLKVIIGGALTPALLEIVEGITEAVVGMNKELGSSDSMAAIHEWGVEFRKTILSIRIDFKALSVAIDDIHNDLLASKEFMAKWFSPTGERSAYYKEVTAEAAKAKKGHEDEYQALVNLEKKYLSLTNSISGLRKREDDWRASYLAETGADKVAPIKAGAGANELTDAQIQADAKAAKAFVKIMEERTAGLQAFYGDAAELSKMASDEEIEAFKKRTKEKEKMEADSYKYRFALAKEYEDSLRESQKEESTTTGPVKGYGFEDAMNAAAAYGNVQLAIETMNSELGNTQTVLMENQSYISMYTNAWLDANLAIVDSIQSLYSGMQSWVSSSIQGLIEGVTTVQDVFKDLGKMMLGIITDYVAKWLVSRIFMAVMENAFLAQQTAATVGAASIIGAAWLEPAYLATVATLGGAAAEGVVALGLGMAAAQGLSMAFKGFEGTLGAGGGSVSDFAAGGTGAAFASGSDYVPATMPALVHKGERILTPEQNKDLTKFIGGEGKSGGGDVYLDGDLVGKWLERRSRQYGNTRMVFA